MDDLEFVRSCTTGDRQAWDRFIEKYSRLIYSCVYGVLVSKGSAFAQSHTQDVFQDFFCFLLSENFKKLRTFKAKNNCSLASWLRQVAVNFTIDYLRKTKTTVSLEEENSDELSLKDILEDSAKAAPDTLDDKEMLSELRDCINLLSNEDKYFLELYLRQGLDLEELREHLRISRGAVDMRKSRLMERLRECFRSKGLALPLS